MNIKLRKKGSALQESLHLLRNNFIHRHKYSSAAWKEIEDNVIMRNSTIEAMTDMMGTLNDTFTRYLPKHSMSLRNNKIRGQSVGVGFTVRRGWNWKRFAAIGTGTSVLWGYGARLQAHPVIAAASLTLITTFVGVYTAPLLCPLEVSKICSDSPMSAVLQVGDQVLTVCGQDVSRKSAHAVQHLLDHGQYGDPVNVTVVRKNALHRTPQTRTGPSNEPVTFWSAVRKFAIALQNKVLRTPSHETPMAPQVKVLRSLPHGEAELHVDFVRDFQSVASVEASVLPLRRDPHVGVGLLKIREFSDETYEEVCDALTNLRERLRDQHNRSMEALVLDLRGNPGGAVVPALDIAALFLPKGTMLMQMRDSQSTEKHFSTNPRPDRSTALLLLTDGRTASASEILLEALCDNGRATSMGTRTVGKNVAQV